MPGTLTNKSRTFLVIATVLLSVYTTYAQTTRPSPVDLSFEKKIPDWLKETNVPAVGIGIIENGKLKYTKVFGTLKKRANGEAVPAPSNTIFQVASLTKPVVGILTLQLVTTREWDLDEPLANYWI